MFKNDKKVNSGLATKRVKDLLDEHIRMLTRKNRTFQVIRDEGYYLDQPINPDNPEDYVKIGYILQKKFLTRTFCLEFRTAIKDVYFPEEFKLKLNFRGFPQIERVYFKGKKESEKYEKYFNDTGLLEKLKRIALIVDIDFVTIEYNRSLAALIIRVAPIPGGVIWIVFPPLYYKMPLKQIEIDALWDAMLLLRKFAMKKAGDNNWV